jgi:hypothetical protein
MHIYIQRPSYAHTLTRILKCTHTYIDLYVHSYTHTHTHTHTHTDLANSPSKAWILPFMLSMSVFISSNINSVASSRPPSSSLYAEKSPVAHVHVCQSRPYACFSFHACAVLLHTTSLHLKITCSARARVCKQVICASEFKHAFRCFAQSDHLARTHTSQS